MLIDFQKYEKELSDNSFVLFGNLANDTRQDLEASIIPKVTLTIAYKVRENFRNDLTKIFEEVSKEFFTKNDQGKVLPDVRVCEFWRIICQRVLLKYNIDDYASLDSFAKKLVEFNPLFKDFNNLDYVIDLIYEASKQKIMCTLMEVYKQILINNIQCILEEVKNCDFTVTNYFREAGLVKKCL